MARLIFFILLILILYYLLNYLIKVIPSPKKKEKTEPEELVQDPYCQTYIPKQTAIKKKVEGHVLYFCSEKCLKSYIWGEGKNSAQ